MPEVVTFGESMARLNPTVVGPLRHAPTLSLGIAGAEANVAIGLARLGIEVSWTGRVGDDEFGRLISTVLRGQGVNARVIVDSTAPTGLLFTERRTAAHSRVIYYRKGSAGSHLGPNDLDEDAIAGARVLHLTGITPALSASARQACLRATDVARANGTTVSLDLNFRRGLWTAEEAQPVLTELVRRAQIVFATGAEAAIIMPVDDALKMATAIAEHGPAEVVIKSGRDGAIAVADGFTIVAPVYSVDELDSVGAGDAFAAGYLREYCAGSDVAARLRTAAACGAIAVTVNGDWEGLPYYSEIDALVSSADVAR